MAQCMETWLVTDRAQLKAVYKDHFHENKLPRHANLEAVHKDEILAKLNAATGGTYHKGNDSFTLLAGLDPQKLKTLPHASQFFAAVELLGRP